MKPTEHPLQKALEARVRLLETTLQPSTVKQYRRTVRLFLGYLSQNFPEVHLHVLPLVGGNLEDLVQEVDAGGGAQQDDAGKQRHGTGRMGRRGTIASMNASMAQPWKSRLSWVSSVLLGAVFLLAGLWKITDVQGAAVRMVQAKVPESMGLAAAPCTSVIFQSPASR